MHCTLDSERCIGARFVCPPVLDSSSKQRHDAQPTKQTRTLRDESKFFDEIEINSPTQTVPSCLSYSTVIQIRNMPKSKRSRAGRLHYVYSSMANYSNANSDSPTVPFHILVHSRVDQDGQAVRPIPQGDIDAASSRSRRHA